MLRLLHLPSPDRLLCRLGYHTRSRGRARRSGEGWVSHCRRCAVPMAKPAGEGWHVVAEPAPGSDARAA